VNRKPIDISSLPKLKNEKGCPLKLSYFRNRGGSISIRVSGTLEGKRVQKNESTLEEATKFRDALLRLSVQGQSSALRAALTRFPDEESLHDAELAYGRLQAKLPGASLVVAVEDYLRRNTAEITDISMTEAIANFAQARADRKNRLQTIETSTILLKAFQRHQKLVKVSDLTAIKSSAWIQSANSLRTQRDRYDLLCNFYRQLKFAKNLALDPLEGITRPIWKKETPVEFPSLEEAQALIDAAASHVADGVVGAMLPYFAICLFSGMRPDETKRLKADWSQVILENKVIYGFGAKVKELRTVEIHEPLLGILERCKAAGLAPGFWRRPDFRAVQNAFRDPTGRKGRVKQDETDSQSPTPANAVSPNQTQDEEDDRWVRDYLRHGYATYHWAANGDMPYLTRVMGNSATVLRCSYINRTVLHAQGKQFFQLQPKWPENFGQRVAESRPPRRRRKQQPAKSGEAADIQTGEKAPPS
jgi:integrase